MLANIFQSLSFTDRTSRVWMVAYVITATIAATAEAGGIGMIYLFFQVALDPVSFGGMGSIAALHQWLGAPPINRFLAMASVVVMVIFSLRALLLLGCAWVSASLRRRLQRNLGGRLFRAYLGNPLAWHQVRGTTYLLNNLVYNVAAVSQNIIVSALDLLSALIMVAMLLGTMMVLQPVETMIAGTVLGVLSLAYLTAMHRRVAEWGRLTVRANERLYRIVREPLRGIKTVKLLGLEAHFARQVDGSLHQFLDMFVRQNMVQQIPRYVLEVVLVGGVLMAVAVALGTGRNATEIVPTMALFGAAAIRLLPQAARIVQMLQTLRFSEASLTEVGPDLRALPANATAEVTVERPRPPAHFDVITLKDVGFFYPEAARPALRGVNLEIHRGEHIALVGLSGAGKTTLADVILGLAIPTAGSLSMDGGIPDPFPHSLFAYVPQEPFILQDSLRRNIALEAAAGGDIDPVRLEAAVDRAAFRPVIARLEAGLDTEVGEDGTGLSGGERQRLSLARALYQDAEVIVMDEPTSALDALTEAVITETIAAVKGTKTVIVIAHRLSTVKNFDRIVFMQDGTIVAMGSYQELYNTCPSFKVMVDFLSVAPEEPLAAT